MIINPTLFLGQHLLCEPSAAQAFLMRLAALSEPANSALLAALLNEAKPPQVEVVGKVAIVPLRGMIGTNLGPMERASGMADLVDFSANLRAAQANPAVSRILLDVDSPGGYTRGVEEAANLVRNSKKPVEAFGSSIHSAAYWIASAARKVTGMRSGSYGSIGTVAIATDISEALAKQGVKVHRIASGIYKGAFMPGAEITPEHLEMEKSRIVENADTFKKAVLQTRSTVADDSMEGQWFYGKEAAKRGLITGIAEGREEVLARLNA